MADAESRSGVRYADAQIVEYVDAVHSSLDSGLLQAFTAPERENMPEIMVGLSEGRFLNLILRLIGAERVVEVGTLAGFSAIHMAQALNHKGHLWTIEFEATHAEVARKNIHDAGLANRITVVEADGMDGLGQVETAGPFDAVFLDADKGNYDRYARWAFSNLRAGGLLLVDNAYLFGQLMEDNEEAAAVRRMHEEVSTHCDSVCIPTPDGLVLAILRKVVPAMPA